MNIKREQIKRIVYGLYLNEINEAIILHRAGIQLWRVPKISWGQSIESPSENQGVSKNAIIVDLKKRNYRFLVFFWRYDS